MRKSINMSLKKADKALLVHCSHVFHQANQGNPVPLVDVMRDSKEAILAYNPKVELVRLMGDVSTYVRCQVMRPATRAKEIEIYEQCIEAIGTGLKSLNERQALFLRDATELYMRVWLGQYSHLNFAVGSGAFNSLSNSDVWETVSNARLDGVGINNPKVPENVRHAWHLNTKMVELCKAFRNEREASGKEFE